MAFELFVEKSFIQYHLSLFQKPCNTVYASFRKIANTAQCGKFALIL